MGSYLDFVIQSLDGILRKKNEKIRIYKIFKLYNFSFMVVCTIVHKSKLEPIALERVP